MYKQFIQALAGLVCAVGVNAAVHADTYDYLLFAASWEPGFCVSHSSTSECQAITSSSYAASHFSLHGLWPNNYDGSYPSYCGVPASQVNLDTSSTWCQMADYGVSSNVFSTLQTSMPGAASCLDKHEWYKHGTCADQSTYASTDPDTYWATADWLVSRLGQTRFNAYVAGNAGKYVSRSQLLSAFQSSFGSGTSAAVSLQCTKYNGRSYFTEARIAIDPATIGNFPAASSLITDASVGGTCPSSSIYIAKR